MIVATDCSFVPKNGKQTEGLGKLYNGVRGKAEKGLELYSRVDCYSNFTLHLVSQTFALGYWA